MQFYIEHQLNFMMILSGICGFISLFLMCMRISDRRKKEGFLHISLFAMILLSADRLAYIYRGDVSILGFWMVRICNFLVYASILLAENGFNNYLLSFAEDETVDSKKDIFLKLGRMSAIVGLCLLVLSQFTGLYYTFDDTNHYMRAHGFIICYIVPLIITVFQFIFILINRRIFRKKILISLFVFMALPIVASLAQIPFYGASFTSISIAISAITIYFFALFDQNNVLIDAANVEMAAAIELKERADDLMHQTVQSLASAVDAKDTYTHGHSSRVAKYARKIAEVSGLSEAECEEVYLAGLLHDVGKIGIGDGIINKKGKLTKEEFDIIKQHPVLGGQILSKIVISPSLSIGALYHHERYDGSGYPDGLKGEDIPHIARIISVADAYDAMTSKRSYRDMIPRMYVREELVKGMGTQFDPNYAKIMLHLLDRDEEYKMKESQTEEIFGADLSYDFDQYKTKVSAGVHITECPVSIKIQYEPIKEGGIPSLLFYDSADARYYLEESSLSEEMDFVEFASIHLDGDVSMDFVRETQHDIEKKQTKNPGKAQEASLWMIKQDDHLLVKITTPEREDTVICALYDASRFVYLALTGRYCHLDILDVDIAKEPVKENSIPRIAEKISYIDKPAGDIPNVQVDGWMAARSEIFEIADHVDVSFHTMSLPSSRRVWHCPIICLYISDDGQIDGPNYKEIVAVRLDGEAWCEDQGIINNTSASKGENFENWSVWKQKNKSGVDCRLSLSHKGDVVNLQVENSGLLTVNQTRLQKQVDKVYCYFTGDQCAITDIQINRKG